MWVRAAGGKTDRSVDGLLVSLALGAQLLLVSSLLEEPISALGRLLRGLQRHGTRRMSRVERHDERRTGNGCECTKGTGVGGGLVREGG